MANTNFLKLTAILSLLALHHSLTMAFHAEHIEDEDEYVLDNPSSLPRSIIKKGTRCDCDPFTFSICDGVPANKGTALLFCCKKHCRNVLGDKNNCGQCGHRCEQGGRCCNGVCTQVLFNEHHCGKCSKKCPPGVPCEHGFCGYA